jgi:hypothetical protein
LDGREFAAITPTTYDWRPTSDVLEDKEPVRATRSRSKASTPGSKGPASDEAIRKAVKATERPEDKPKPRTTTTTRKRTK